MARNDGMAYLSNDFIRACGFNYTMQEWRIFLRLVSLVNKYDSPDTVYSMQIEELARAIGLKTDTRRGTLTQLKNKVKGMADKSFYMEYGTKSDLIRAINDPSFEHRNGIFKFCFGENIRNLIFNQNGGFTAVDASIANSIDSPFTLKLYLLLKSYASVGSVKLFTDKLFNILYDRVEKVNYNTGKKYAAIKNKELSTGKLSQKLRDALTTIATMTDLSVELIPIKGEHGKNIIAFEFKINSNGFKGYYTHSKHVNRSKAKQASHLAKQLVYAVEQSADNEPQDIAAAARDVNDKHIIEILYNHDVFKELDETARRIVAANEMDRVKRVLEIISDWT